MIETITSHAYKHNRSITNMSVVSTLVFRQLLNIWFTFWHPINSCTSSLSPSISLNKYNFRCFSTEMTNIVIYWIINPLGKFSPGHFLLRWIFYVCLGFIVPEDNCWRAANVDLYTRHPWPLSREGSLTCHTYSNLKHPFVMSSPDPWH